MLGCDTDKCARDKWEEGKFDEDSQGNVQYANDIAGLRVQKWLETEFWIRWAQSLT